MNEHHTTYEKSRECELDRCFPGIRRELPRIFAVCHRGGPIGRFSYPPGDKKRLRADGMPAAGLCTNPT
jgi:hypothetical protein